MPSSSPTPRPSMNPSQQVAPCERSPDPGLLIIGHGTRDQRGTRDFHTLVAATPRFCRARSSRDASWNWSSPTSARRLARPSSAASVLSWRCPSCWSRPGTLDATSPANWPRPKPYCPASRSARRRTWARTKTCCGWPAADMPRHCAARIRPQRCDTAPCRRSRHQRRVGQCRSVLLRPPTLGAGSDRLARDWFSRDDRAVTRKRTVDCRAVAFRPHRGRAPFLVPGRAFGSGP